MSNPTADKRDVEPQAAMEASVEQRARDLSSYHARSREHERHLNTVGSGQCDLLPAEAALSPCCARVFVPLTCKTLSKTGSRAKASEKVEAIPAPYQEVDERVLVAEGQLAWRAILCETNTTGEVIAKLQNPLRKAGFNPGPVDGRLGNQRLTAGRDYQRRRGAAEGQITMETLQQLQVR